MTCGEADGMKVEAETKVMHFEDGWGFGGCLMHGWEVGEYEGGCTSQGLRQLPKTEEGNKTTFLFKSLGRPNLTPS